MSPAVDAIVLGLGAMGSAAAYHLARRGLRVVGLDQYHPPHGHGSSSGRSRIIREAYFESPAYVPLVQRAYQLWGALEQDYGAPLLRTTGGLTLGPEDGGLFQGALASVEAHRLRHRVLSGRDVSNAYRPWQVPNDWAAVYEFRAGVLFPERCVAAHLHLARRHGADLRFGAQVTDWTADAAGVSVLWRPVDGDGSRVLADVAPPSSAYRPVRRTAQRELRARHLIVAAGPWVADLIPALQDQLSVMRQVQLWFEPVDADAFRPNSFPVFVAEHAPGRYFYGVPDFGDGVKAAVHYEGASTGPGRASPPSADDEAALRQLAEPYLQDLGQCLGSQVCLYTNTSDHHFVIDRHPQQDAVLVLSPCSGHGFKFSSAIGELAADLVEGRAPSVDIAPFQMSRF